MSKRLIFAELSKVSLFFFRLGGAGLGNNLITISRALVLADKMNLELRYPTFPQVKFGPIIRREKTYRGYWNDFSPQYILRLRQIFKKDIKVSGLGNYFHDLKGHETLIRSWIYKFANIHIDCDKICHVGMHVRRGDFVKGFIEGGTNQQLDIDWYIKALNKVRHLNGEKSLKVLLSTDGDYEKIKVKLLERFDGVEIIENNNVNTISEIVALSKCKILIASNSTFSLWSNFLSNNAQILIIHKDFAINKYMPTISDYIIKI